MNTMDFPINAVRIKPRFNSQKWCRVGDPKFDIIKYIALIN